MIFVDLRTIPGAGVHRRGPNGGGRAHHERTTATFDEAHGVEREKKEKKQWGGGTRVFHRFPSSPYL